MEIKFAIEGIVLLWILFFICCVYSAYRYDWLLKNLKRNNKGEMKEQHLKYFYVRKTKVPLFYYRHKFPQYISKATFVVNIFMIISFFLSLVLVVTISVFKPMINYGIFMLIVLCVFLISCMLLQFRERYYLRIKNSSYEEPYKN